MELFRRKKGKEEKPVRQEIAVREAAPMEGLTETEAAERAAAGWQNLPVEPPTRTARQIVRENLLTYFNLVFLVLALCLVAVKASILNLSFVIVVIINAVIGIVQELRSKKALDALHILSAPQCAVVREGRERRVDVSALVRDDIVIFTSGEQVCADAVVVEGECLVNEALVTGEADEIRKSPGDTLLSGSFLVSGICRARLTAVGADSFVSRLTLDAKAQKKRRPKGMMKALSDLVKWIGIGIIPVGVLLAVKEIFWLHRSVQAGVTSTVGALVGMIPEGVYLLTSLALVAGVLRLAQKKTMCREMDCIETLARVDTLCVDKTGTVTENKMTVEDIVPLCPDRFIAEDIHMVMADYCAAMRGDNDTMAVYEPFPDSLDPRLLPVLEKRGVHQLYRHQAHAIREVLAGRDVVVVTPTASGKTMCYNLPVLSAILQNDDARALYLFPTKALSADQVSELYELIEAMGVDIKTYTYDGDTPGAARKAVRQAGHIVVTNPDMLHSGILPHHTKWVKLFENLRYIVIDEIHTYRGVFGSNLANVLRRLLRLCDFYGSHPQFILCSATIANPKELAETLTGREVSLVDDNGAPMGVRHFVFYNPPVVNRQLGIRKGVLQETRRIAGLLLQNGIQAITFARSRLAVEVLTKYLKDMVRDPLGNAGRVRGYRGGYLPTERREIERGLRAGRVDAVVSTNALELGIDIGALDACVLCGYPGTIASAWQQAGRAGRRKGTSIVFYVASSAALDQYIVAHPDYLMKQSPENALLNPDNLYILLNHFKCAAFELPFEDGEGLGNAPGAPELLEYLDEAGILRHVGGRYHWSAEDFPASEISLRSARAEENFVIIDTTDPANHRVIGEMDRYTVPMLLHENAIYMHEAQQYQVEKLDFDACKAFIRRVDVGYYTDADLNVTLSLLDKEKEEEQDGGLTALGEIRVSTLVTMFKKIKFDTHETLGFGHVRLPETEMHTTAMWWTLPDALAARFESDTLKNGMMGVANLLRIVAPLSLMCAPQDIAIVYQVKSPLTDKPTLLLYDNIPGGIGLAQKAYAMRKLLLEQALQVVRDCACRQGCPGCVGPVGEIGEDGKATAIALLEALTE